MSETYKVKKRPPHLLDGQKIQSRFIIKNSYLTTKKIIVSLILFFTIFYSSSKINLIQEALVYKLYNYGGNSLNIKISFNNPNSDQTAMKIAYKEKILSLMKNKKIIDIRLLTKEIHNNTEFKKVRITRINPETIFIHIENKTPILALELDKTRLLSKTRDCLFAIPKA